MMQNKRMIATIVEIAVGIALWLTATLGSLDAYWSGMGTALVTVGVLQLVRQIKYKTNDTYREAVDVQANDERNKYISMKAWSWAGYFFVLIAAISSIVLKIAGYESLVLVASGSVCLILVLYWLSWLYLRKKY